MYLRKNNSSPCEAPPPIHKLQLAARIRIRQAGSVIRNDFTNIQGSWSAAQNDDIFAGLRMCAISKVYSHKGGSDQTPMNVWCLSLTPS